MSRSAPHTYGTPARALARKTASEAETGERVKLGPNDTTMVEEFPELRRGLIALTQEQIGLTSHEVAETLEAENCPAIPLSRPESAPPVIRQATGVVWIDCASQSKR